jgi:hypothetical protein
MPNSPYLLYGNKQEGQNIINNQKSNLFKPLNKNANNFNLDVLFDESSEKEDASINAEEEAPLSFNYNFESAKKEQKNHYTPFSGAKLAKNLSRKQSETTNEEEKVGTYDRFFQSPTKVAAPQP